MYYILAKEIVQKCIEQGILQKVNGCIPLYEEASDSDPERYPEGWVLYPEEDVSFSHTHFTHHMLPCAPATAFSEPYQPF